MKICPKCKTPNPEANNSCNHCGATFPTQEALDPQNGDDASELKEQIKTLQQKLQSTDAELGKLQQAIKIKDEALAGLERQLGTATRELEELRNAPAQAAKPEQAEAALKQAVLDEDAAQPIEPAKELHHSFVAEIKEKFEDAVHGKEQRTGTPGEAESSLEKEVLSREQASVATGAETEQHQSFLHEMKEKIEEEIHDLRGKKQAHEESKQPEPDHSLSSEVKDGVELSSSNQHSDIQVAPTLTLESYPLKKMEFHLEMKAGDQALDLLSTAFRIRATLERRGESIEILVQPGATVKVRMSEKQKWERFTGGSRMTAVEGLILFDPSGAMNARLQGGQ